MGLAREEVCVSRTWERIKGLDRDPKIRTLNW